MLRFNRFEPCVIHVRDSRDSNPDIWGDVQAADIESGAERDITVTPRFLEDLAKNYEERRALASRYCLARGVPFFSVDVEQPFDEIVLGVLRRGGLLR